LLQLFAKEDAMFDMSASKHGLPPCLWVPIAAASVDAIRQYVGTVLLTSATYRAGEPNAVCVRPHESTVHKDPRVKLWTHARASEYEGRLYPPRQVWVHVDYDGYRNAYQLFGMSAIPAGYFLDHVQNREAIRLRDYSHPYLRLCPVSRQVNTSGGHDAGGEGMEKAYRRELRKGPLAAEAAVRARQGQIIYADPMDLTKMLDIPPGTGTLEGVRTTQVLFFPV
jgi:hypothetical protein